jgi:hypothetical protein
MWFISELPEEVKRARRPALRLQAAECAEKKQLSYHNWAAEDTLSSRGRLAMLDVSTSAI